MVTSPADLLSVTQAAAALGLSRSRVKQFCLTGRLGRRVGNAYVISAAELERFRKLKRRSGRPVTP